MPSLTIELGFIIFLLFCSGFMSASEVAFFSMSPQKLNFLKENSNVKTRRVKKLRSNPELLLATILISNNLINIAMIMLSAIFVNAWLNFSSPLQAFVIQSVVITFLLLLFGEIMPKVYANEHPVTMALRSSLVLVGLQAIFKPFSRFLIKSTQLVKNRLKKSPANTLSIDELEQAVDLTSDDKDTETDILKGIAQLMSQDASGIMTSRMDMITVDFSMTYKEVKEIILKCELSRIPVIDSSFDDVKGILYAKDLIAHIDDKDDFKWQDTIRKVYFVPEMMRIDALLQDFQANHVHIAIVVDEFGGTSGLVTLEDVLEEVVGEINDEHDHDADVKRYAQLDESTFYFDAKISLNDFFKATGLKADHFSEYTDDVDSLAGLILEKRGDIPVAGEVIELKNLVFTILEVDDRRIVRIKLHINEEEKDED